MIRLHAKVDLDLCSNDSIRPDFRGPCCGTQSKGMFECGPGGAGGALLSERVRADCPRSVSSPLRMEGSVQVSIVSIVNYIDIQVVFASLPLIQGLPQEAGPGLTGSETEGAVEKQGHCCPGGRGVLTRGGRVCGQWGRGL
uniref:Uncharacterized protein n=1 Tax=Knipowitschia caucasica TaxID=637954 RepID=A0AAV2K3W2_KNICA